MLMNIWWTDYSSVDSLAAECGNILSVQLALWYNKTDNGEECLFYSSRAVEGKPRIGMVLLLSVSVSISHSFSLRKLISGFWQIHYRGS